VRPERLVGGSFLWSAPTDTRSSGRPPQLLQTISRESRLLLVTGLVLGSLAAILHRAALQLRPDRFALPDAIVVISLPSRRRRGREPDAHRHCCLGVRRTHAPATEAVAG
jgi:hypothetical protein